MQTTKESLFSQAMPQSLQGFLFRKGDGKAVQNIEDLSDTVVQTLEAIFLSVNSMFFNLFKLFFPNFPVTFICKGGAHSWFNSLFTPHSEF